MRKVKLQEVQCDESDLQVLQKYQVSQRCQVTQLFPRIRKNGGERKG